MRLPVLLALIASLPLTASALETDNYIVWEQSLPDSALDFNAFFAARIDEALADVNAHAVPASCEAVSYRIAAEFKTVLGTNPIEDFAHHGLPGKVFPAEGKYVEESILHNTRFYLRFSGLAPNVQINGVYLGLDKLAHFASTGRRYLKRYLKRRRAGADEAEATRAAIRYGLLNEASVLGWWASGVFSYGDMEANYQGLRFYKKLCLEGGDSYLSQDEAGKWYVAMAPDLRDYVNPYWDESYNPSYYTASSWPVVRDAIVRRYCAIKTSETVQERFRYYDDFNHTSFSLEYIRELQARGFRNAPIPTVHQTVPNLCEDAEAIAKTPPEPPVPGDRRRSPSAPGGGPATNP